MQYFLEFFEEGEWYQSAFNPVEGFTSFNEAIEKLDHMELLECPYRIKKIEYFYILKKV